MKIQAESILLLLLLYICLSFFLIKFFSKKISKFINFKLFTKKAVYVVTLYICVCATTGLHEIFAFTIYFPSLCHAWLILRIVLEAMWLIPECVHWVCPTNWNMKIIKLLVKSSGLQLNICLLACVKRKVALGRGIEKKEQSRNSCLPFWKSQAWSWEQMSSGID